MYDWAGGFMGAWGLAQGSSPFQPSWMWEWQVGYSTVLRGCGNFPHDPAAAEHIHLQNPLYRTAWKRAVTMDSFSTGSTYWQGSVCPDVGSPTLQTTQPFVCETGLSPNAQINQEGNSNWSNTLPSEGSSWAAWEGSYGPILRRPWWFWTNSSSDHFSLSFTFSICMMGTVHYQCHYLLPQQLLWKKKRCHVKWCWKILVYSKSPMNINKAVDST